MAYQFKYFTWLVLAFALLTSCKKDVEGEGNDEELITTFQLTFKPAGGGVPLTFKIEDLDGPGGAEPIQDTIILKANTNYNVNLQLLNKAENPIKDVTLEIAEESEAHRFYYEPSITSKVFITDLDLDVAGNPLGLFSIWKTNIATKGQVQITLRHYPGNPPDKAMNDPVTSPKSTTDIEAVFPIMVQ